MRMSIDAGLTNASSYGVTRAGPSDRRSLSHRIILRHLSLLAIDVHAPQDVHIHRDVSTGVVRRWDVTIHIPQDAIDVLDRIHHQHPFGCRRANVWIQLHDACRTLEVAKGGAAAGVAFVLLIVKLHLRDHQIVEGGMAEAEPALENLDSQDPIRWLIVLRLLGGRKIGLVLVLGDSVGLCHFRGSIPSLTSACHWCLLVCCDSVCSR